MNAKTVARAGWGTYLVLAVGAAVTTFASDGQQTRIAMLICFGVFATLGALIVARKSEHPVGWIYLSGAIAATLGELASALTAAGGSLSRVAVVWWVRVVLSVVPLLVLIPLPLLLFPDGELPSRRWRPALWLAIAAIAMVGAYPAFAPGALVGEGGPVNPLGIGGATSMLQGLNQLGLATLGVIVVATIVSLFRRHRRATGAERQRFRWLAWAGVWTIVLLFMSGPGTFGGMLPDRVARALMVIVPYLFALALAAIPIAIAIAILRFHLWDIDRIVSRTVSYAIVTAVLSAVYAIVAVVIPDLFLAGSDTPSALIAAGTLAAAGAFGPVRRRVQARVDRRFNRARYDATRTVAAFASRLRDNIDIDTLAVELEGLVDRTMRPAHLFLWVARR